VAGLSPLVSIILFDKKGKRLGQYNVRSGTGMTVATGAQFYGFKISDQFKGNGFSTIVIKASSYILCGLQFSALQRADQVGGLVMTVIGTGSGAADAISCDAGGCSCGGCSMHVAEARSFAHHS
jgi:hypothetical protein